MLALYPFRVRSNALLGAGLVYELEPNEPANHYAGPFAATSVYQQECGSERPYLVDQFA
jgi:hypothetical protein